MRSFLFLLEAWWAEGPRGPTGNTEELCLLRASAQADPSGY